MNDGGDNVFSSVSFSEKLRTFEKECTDVLLTHICKKLRACAYRGVTSCTAKNIRALSWTLDYETADWFAHRFGETGKVYEARINKEHIYVLFNSRGEWEVIVDPKYLTELREAPKQEEGPTLTQ